MIMAAVLLGGCSSSKDRQALPDDAVVAVKKTAEQTAAFVSEDNKTTETPEITGQSVEVETTPEAVAAAESGQAETPVETTAPEPASQKREPQTTKARQAAEEQQAVTEPPMPAPEPATQATQPPAPKSIYDYEFDVEAIRAELIAIGQSRGLTHIITDDGNACTPDNSSWAMPVTASQNFQGDLLKRALHDYVSSMPDVIQMTGGNIHYFTIYVEPAGNGCYTFYFLY